MIFFQTSHSMNILRVGTCVLELNEGIGQDKKHE